MVIACREAERARKLSEAAREPASWALPEGPGTPDGSTGRANGLHSIAAALDAASPFYVKQEGADVEQDYEDYDSDDEVLC